MEKTIGDRIRLLMQLKQLNATQLAEIIDVQRSSISHVLSGRNKPGLEMVQKIVSHFSDISYEWLITGEEKNDEIKKNISKDTSVFGKSVNIVTSNTDKDTKKVSDHSMKPSPSPLFTGSNKGETKRISKIVVFYNDNTFEEYFS